MVALSGTEKLPEGVEVQAKRLDGVWGAWQPLHTDDAIDNKIDPLWVGDSTDLRVRGANQSGLSVTLIDPGTRASDAPKQLKAANAAPPAVISRAAWGADENIRTQCFARQGIGIDYSSTIKAGAIHHTVDSNDYTPADSARIMRGIYVFHAVTRDWCDVGYNMLVDKFGQIFEGRIGGLGSPVWGAHAGGFNQYTFGVSMIGTFTSVAPSPEQIEAVSSVVAWKLSNGYRDPMGRVTLISGGGGTSKYPAGTPVDLPVIFAHRDVGNTECPGQVAYDMMPLIRDKVVAKMGNYQASPVYQRWQQTGGEGGPLGSPYQIETDAARGGRMATFATNQWSIYWNTATGAQIVGGAIRERWLQIGADFGAFGYPKTDELTASDNVGRYNDFEGANGSIYWTPQTGAHAIQGDINVKWAELGKHNSSIGYPITSELVASDGAGRYNDFSRDIGSIYWSRATGAHAIQGGIKEKWAEYSKERGVLGYPITDEKVTADGVGRYNDFSGDDGSIYWTPGTKAHAIHGGIKLKWAQLNKERGILGYPTTDEMVTPNGLGRYNHFSGEGGSIYWSAATGAHEVHGLIKQHWGNLGWEGSYLGFPTSDEYMTPAGPRSDFQGGYVLYEYATGRVIDSRYP